MYVLINTYFWNEFLILWTSEDLKNSATLGELSKNHLIAFCPYMDCISMLNLLSLAPMVSEKSDPNMTDIQTDRRNWLNRFFLSRWTRIYYLVIGCQKSLALFLLNFQFFIKLVTIMRFKSNMRRFVRWRIIMPLLFL